jgi:hypothetical protein
MVDDAKCIFVLMAEAGSGHRSAAEAIGGTTGTA